MGKPSIRFESGQTAYPFEVAVNTGDNTVFTASFAPICDADLNDIVAPYGLMTGGAITPTATNNQVSVAALTACMAGAAGADAKGVVAVASGNLTITRPATEVSKVNSITVDATGSLAMVAGTDGSTTTFTETRGAAGGPPLIPVGSIEIGQVRVISDTAAVVTTAQIYSVIGLHVERFDFPGPKLDYGTGKITFPESLPLIHTGPAPKKVYVKGAVPLFAPVINASDWVPAESTYSISSTDTYDGPIGSSSSSLGQASFSVVLKNGITDDLVAAEGKKIWIEFRPDRDKSVPKQLTQGILGLSRTYPGENVPTSCTVTPTSKTMNVKA